MTDPLRPMVSLIEAIARNTQASSTTASEQNQSYSSAADKIGTPAASISAKPFATLLKTRLAGMDRKDKATLRKVFVEVSLLSEMGEQLVVDPGFATLVEQVSAIIAADKHSISQLDKTLQSYFS